MSILPTRRQYATLLFISEVSASFDGNVVPEELVNAICHRMDVKPKGLRDERWLVLDQSAGYRVDSGRMPKKEDGLSGPPPKPLPEEAAENLLSHWTAGVRDIEHRHFLSPASKTSAYRCPLDGAQLVACLADVGFAIQVKRGPLSGQELGNVVARYVSKDAFQLRQFLLQEGYVTGRTTFQIATKGRIRIEQAKAESKLTPELVHASILERGGDDPQPEAPAARPTAPTGERRTKVVPRAQPAPEPTRETAPPTPIVPPPAPEPARRSVTVDRATLQPSPAAEPPAAPAPVAIAPTPPVAAPAPRIDAPPSITADPTTWPERPLEAGGNRDLPPKKKTYGVEELDKAILRSFVNAPDYDDLRLAFMRRRRLSIGQTDWIRASLTLDGTAPARSSASQRTETPGDAAVPISPEPTANEPAADHAAPVATAPGPAPTEEDRAPIPVRAKHYLALTIIDAQVAKSEDGSFRGDDIARALRHAGIRTPVSQTLHELSKLGVLDVVEKGGPRKQGRYRRSPCPYVRDDGTKIGAAPAQAAEGTNAIISVTPSNFDALTIIDAVVATKEDRTFGPEDIAADLIAKGIRTHTAQVIFALRTLGFLEVIRKGGRGGPGRYRRTETAYALRGHLPRTVTQVVEAPAATVRTEAPAPAAPVEAITEREPEVAPEPPPETEPFVADAEAVSEPSVVVSTAIVPDDVPPAEAAPPDVAAIVVATPTPPAAMQTSVLDGLEDMRRVLQTRVEERTCLLHQATEALAPRQQRVRLLRAYLGIMDNAIVTCDDALVRGRLCQRKREAECELSGHNLDKEEALRQELETELGADELELAALCAEIDRLTPTTDD